MEKLKQFISRIVHKRLSTGKSAPEESKYDHIVTIEEIEGR
jgi:hypothetical protein